jgi:glycosyltransferase involved in cell wall biosynthesis
MERFCYDHAARICIISEGIREIMQSKGVSAGKIRITPNWANGDLIRPLPASGSLRSELGLKGEFVVLYSGNMGYTMQDLDTVVDAARLLEHESEIVFVLAGDGVRRAAVEKRAQGLRNVCFLPIQALDRFPRLLATADVAVVILSPEGTRASVPSKVYGIMAAGRAVVAICEPVSDTGKLVEEAACGTNVLPGDAEGLANVVVSYHRQRERSRIEGERAREYFEGHYTAEACIAKYDKVMLDVYAERDQR